MTMTRVYRAGALVAENFPVEQVSDYLEDPDCLVWLDVCAPQPEDFGVIAEELSLHHLALEDALSARQRPKVDRYDTHLFLSAYQADLEEDGLSLRTAEVAAFITSQALVTVRPCDDFSVEGMLRRWDDAPELARHGVPFLVHGLLDHIVDSHFTAVETLDEQIDHLEDVLFDSVPGADLQRRIYELRKSLVQLRRVVLPMREVVNSLMRRDLRVLNDAMTPYYQDVYDHVLRASEWTESLRDMVSSILETNLTLQSNRLNVITKQITSWAAIIAIPTAITGFYGQNIPYPGFDQASGFWTSALLTLTVPVILFTVFRRRDWL
jgi:magnesium transporter